MKVAILMCLGSPWSRSIALHLASRGHRVDVVDYQPAPAGYLSRDDVFQADDIAFLRRSVAGVHPLRSWNGSAVRLASLAWDLRRMCHSIRPDLLLTLYAGTPGLIAALSGVRPYAVYCVGSDVLLATGLKRMVTRAVLARAGAVFANGRFLAGEARRLAPGVGVEPIYLGVDTDRLKPAPRREGPVRLVVTRGFAPLYNNQYVVEALSLLPTDTPDFRLTFTSAGPTLDGVRTSADRSLPPRIRARIEFLGGTSSERFLSVLRGSDVYVSVSRSDGTSISLLEALACSLFPVLSDIPPNREWIEPGSDSGLLVPLDRPADLARALREAITDAPRRERAAAQNRKRVVGLANSGETARALEAALENVIR